jgi:hypothetical protein
MESGKDPARQASLDAATDASAGHGRSFRQPNQELEPVVQIAFGGDLQLFVNLCVAPGWLFTRRWGQKTLRLGHRQVQVEGGARPSREAQLQGITTL